MSSIKEGDGIRPRSRFGKPKTRDGMRYVTLRESARKGGAETARQGHSVRVRENEAQRRNAGRSAHTRPRGKQGRQTWHEAKTTKESLHEKKNKTGFGDEENIGMHGFRGD